MFFLGFEDARSEEDTGYGIVWYGIHEDACTVKLAWLSASFSSSDGAWESGLANAGQRGWKVVLHACFVH